MFLSIVSVFITVLCLLYAFLFKAPPHRWWIIIAIV